AVEADHPEPTEPLLTTLLHTDCVAVPLPASTRSSLFRELVKLAEQSWQVYDPDAVLTAIQAREELASTAQDNGVAVLHPRRPPPREPPGGARHGPRRRHLPPHRCHPRRPAEMRSRPDRRRRVRGRALTHSARGVAYRSRRGRPL